MKPISEINLSDLVRQDYRKAEVLENHHLDFCCGGKKTLKSACEEAGIDLKTVIQDLEKLSGSDYDLVDLGILEADQLCDYIERKHHSYVRRSIPQLLVYLEKVYNAHGKRHPELASVNSLFTQVSQELLEHMLKEESVLFPLIRQLTQKDRSQTFSTLDSYLLRIAQPIEAMTQEHEAAGQILKEISLITNNYEPPANACNTYRVMLAKLAEFERDLHMHVHLENNILFPKAIDLQQKLRHLSA